MTSFWCKLGFHVDLVQRAYYTHGEGYCGEARVCTKCGRMTREGHISYIPEHFKEISDKLRESVNQKRKVE